MRKEKTTSGFSAYFIILRVMEYANPLFLNLQDNMRKIVARVQRRCQNIIDGPGCDCNDFPNLRDRRLKQSMILFTKALKNTTHCLHNLTGTTNLRSSRQSRITVPHCASSKRMNVFSFACSVEHNSSEACAGR